MRRADAALRRVSAVGLALVSAVVVGVVGAAFWPSADQPGAGLPAPVDPGAVPAQGGATGGVQSTAPAAQAPAAPAGLASAPVATTGVRSANGVFETDAAGRLVVDERTRLAVEALVGLNPAEAVPGLVAAEVQGLPAQAAAQARELAQRFDAYQAAQRAAFPPGEAPLVPEEGLAELNTLVALRTSYFGEETARRLFGADEAVTRRLLQLMAEDKSGTLSMQEKAQRAQERYDRERGTTRGN